MPPIKRLTQATKCCGAMILVLSNGTFDKSTKGKYICTCGKVHK
jgi:hypothetical protein